MPSRRAHRRGDVVGGLREHRLHRPDAARRRSARARPRLRSSADARDRARGSPASIAARRTSAAGSAGGARRWRRASRPRARPGAARRPAGGRGSPARPRWRARTARAAARCARRPSPCRRWRRCAASAASTSRSVSVGVGRGRAAQRRQRRVADADPALPRLAGEAGDRDLDLVGRGAAQAGRRSRRAWRGGSTVAAARAEASTRVARAVAIGAFSRVVLTPFATWRLPQWPRRTKERAMAMDDRGAGEPLQIWGRISSINVRKVVWCAQELGLAFQRTEAGGRFGVVKTPEYRALNPNGLVPTIEDGDADASGGRFRLWESNVIVRYLCGPSFARRSLSRAAAGALRCRTLDGLAADHAQSGDPERVHAMDSHARGAARRRGWRRARCRRPSRSWRCWTRTSRRERSWAASGSRWPTSRSAASCIAGSACRRRCIRGRRGRTWSATSPALRARPAARGVLDLALE